MQGDNSEGLGAISPAKQFIAIVAGKNSGVSSSQDSSCVSRQVSPTVDHRQEIEVDDRNTVSAKPGFHAKIGNIHPLLVPHILERVLAYVSIDFPETLLSARQVCLDWYGVFQNKTSKAVTFQNLDPLVHTIALDRGNGHTFKWKSRLEPLKVTRIRISDPCFIFSNPNVTSYFRENGTLITYLGFSANLYCREQWVFLRSVLNKFCPNLTFLDLTSVTAVESCILYSGLQSFREILITEPTYKLKKLSIKFNLSGSHSHYHDSEVSKKIGNMGEVSRDGGILTRLLLNSPDLIDLTLHLQRCGVGTFLGHTRVFGTNFSRLRRIEFVASNEHPLQRIDFRFLFNFKLNIQDLVLGPIHSGIDTEYIIRFLASVSDTLSSLEIRGIQGMEGLCTHENVLKFVLPVMPILENLTVTNMSRCQFGSLGVVLDRLPRIRKLSLNFPAVEICCRPSVLHYISSMFNSNTAERHLCLKELVFTGGYAGVIHHEVVCGFLEQAVPQLENLEISTSSLNFPTVHLYRRLKHVKKLKVHIENGKIKDFSLLFNGHFFGLGVFVRNNEVLRLNNLKGLENSVEMELDGFTIHSFEIRPIAEFLASRCCSTTFRNCRVLKSTSHDGLNRELNNVRLDLVNLPVLLETHFREEME